LNVESFGEIEALEAIAQRMALKPRVAVRVNPAFELKSSGMKMGGGPKQFGIDAEEVPRALADIARRDLGFEGFHIFSGSQKPAPRGDLRVADQSARPGRSAGRTRTVAGQEPQPGRRLRHPYFPGERPLELEPIAAHLRQIADSARSRLPEAQLVIELGRYIVGEAGVYVARVIDRKISRGEVFLVVDGGLNHHLAASGNFGQVIRKNYSVAIGTRAASTTARLRRSWVRCAPRSI
jgi:diaminopimelate decarboxylase